MQSFIHLFDRPLPNPKSFQGADGLTRAEKLQADKEAAWAKCLKAVTWPEMDDDALPSAYMTKVLSCVGKWQLKMGQLSTALDAFDEPDNCMKQFLAQVKTIQYLLPWRNSIVFGIWAPSRQWQTSASCCKDYAIYQRLLDISLAYFSWFGSPFFLGLPALRLTEQSKAVAASLMEVAKGLDELNKDAVLNDVNDNDELLAITNTVKKSRFHGQVKHVPSLSIIISCI